MGWFYYVWLPLLFLIFSCQEEPKTQSSAKEPIPVSSISKGALFDYFLKSCESENYNRATQIRFRWYELNEEHLTDQDEKWVTEKLVHLARKTDSDSLLGRAFYKRAIYFRDQYRPEQAYFYYDRSEQLHRKAKDSFYIAKCLLSKSKILLDQGVYYDAEQSAMEMLEFLSQEEKYYQMAAFNYSAMASENMKQYQEAVKWYKKAVQAMPESKYVPIVKNNLAVAYIRSENYEKAIAALQSIKDEEVIVNNIVRKNTILDNLGYAYALNGNFSKGMKLLRKVYHNRLDNEINAGMNMSYIHFAEVLLNRKPLKSFQWAQKVMQSEGDFDTKLRALLVMSQTSPKKPDFYIKRFSYLKDSLLSARQKAADKFAKIRFQTQQKQHKIQELQNVKKRTSLALKAERNKKIVFIISTFSLLILGAAAYYLLKKRHKRNRELAIFQREKELSKNLHDGVANDVYSIMNTLENRPDKQNSEKILDQLDGVYQKTRNFSRDMDTTALVENFQVRLGGLFNSFQNDSVSVMTRNFTTIHLKDLKDSLKIDIYRILQELLTNTKKHSGANLIVVQFERLPKKLKIIYRDNGQGIRAHERNSKNGLQNVENRMHANNGRISFETNSNRGIKIELSFRL